MEAESATEMELADFLAWFESTTSKAGPVIRALVALSRKARGVAGRTFDVMDIAAEAGHPSFDPSSKDTEPARKWVNRLAPEQFFEGQRGAQQTWLQANRPDQRFWIDLEVIKPPGGGAGNRKTYRLVRRLLESPAATPESADEPSVIPSPHLQYGIAFCSEEDLTVLGRWLYGKTGRFERLSWRWWVHISWFMFTLVTLLLFLVTGVLLPAAGIGVLTLKTTVTVLLLLVMIYLLDVRPRLNLVEDRIRMAGDLLLRGIEPAQLEIFRDGDRSEWRLIRYTADCPICNARIHVMDGRPDFPRRLVGRCNESPREHVYSFDRMTRRGKVLVSPY